MKRYFFSFLLFFAVTNSSQATNFNMLTEVNVEWKYNFDGQAMASSYNSSSNQIFNDWITTHLMLVEKTLRARSVQHLSSKQKENRLKLLDELSSYWHNGVYPVNSYLSYKNPVFIDQNGTHCAVGYLMQQSGSETLACAIDQDNKFVFIKNIKTKGVTEWSTENGFTIDELAWIQPGYPTQFNVADMAKGLNGQVFSLAVDPSTEQIYAGGSFSSSTTGSPCNGIAVYTSGFAGWDWIGLGNGIVGGQVNTILIHDNKIYAGGYFNFAGSTSVSNIAVYDLLTQQWQALGSLDSTVNALAVYNNEIYAGGKFTGLFSKWTGSQWQDLSQGFIYGEGVRALEEWNNVLLIGGSFELATGALRRNVAMYDGSYLNGSGMGTLTPVNDFEIFHDTIYAACDFINGTDSCAIAKFVNFDWEVALKPYSSGFDYFNGQSINAIISEDDKLFCVGDFSCSAGMFYGNNMMEFLSNTGGQTSCIPLLIVDDAINTLLRSGNTIVFGGNFSNALSDTLNHIGQLFDVVTKISNTKAQISESLSVFPNPTSSSVRGHINGAVSGDEYMIRIIDQIGHGISNQKINEPDFILDLFTKLSGGIYYIQASNHKGEIIGTNRVVVAP